MSARFEILHALRVKGLARPEVLAGLSGIAVEDLPAAAADLVTEGLVMVREGALAGYMLTAPGRAAAEEALLADATTQAAAPALAQFDEAFLPVNTDFKALCHRWQVRPSGEPNDHTDAEYDAGVVADLAALHATLAPLLAEAASALPRFGRWEPRLAAALARVQQGDIASFARPMYESYHDIWMELHNDVVLSLGRSRTAADESVH